MVEQRNPTSYGAMLGYAFANPNNANPSVKVIVEYMNFPSRQLDCGLCKPNVKMIVAWGLLIDHPNLQKTVKRQQPLLILQLCQFFPS
jgi:hypothetical protein